MFFWVASIMGQSRTQRIVKEQRPKLGNGTGTSGLAAGRIVCGMDSPERPDDLNPEIAEMSYTPDPEASSTPDPGASSGIAAVMKRNEARLFAIDGVEGLNIGRDQIGRDAILIFVFPDRSVESRLPRDIEGFPVIVEVTGIIQPL